MLPRTHTDQLRFDDLIAVIESTRKLAEAADTAEAMSLFARELTLLFDASACLISEFDDVAETVTDWAAYVIPPAKLNVVAEDYPLRARFARLTTQEERARLYESPALIGTREGWRAVLETCGVEVRGHRVIRRG